MAESRLIDGYLTELRFSLAKLTDVDDIVDEAADHLHSAVDARVARGMSRTDAEADALATFGSAALVSKVFVEEAKRGGAVSTTQTRRAGLAAIASVVLFTVGQSGNDPAGRGTVHGMFLAMIAFGLAAFAFGLWGIRLRHGGLGLIGRVAFWWFVASPLLAAPFGWGAGAALAGEWLLIMVLLGVGMIRARVLPVPAVVLFTLSPVVSVVIGLLSSRELFNTQYGFLVPIAPVCVGYMWLGWAMWHEPALDTRRSRHDAGPLAA
jgi:hypothetical protein